MPVIGGNLCAGLWAVSAGAFAWVSTACIVGVYLLAGLPGLVEVCLHVAAGEVNPHVLMILSALGCVALGRAYEVGSSPLLLLIWLM